MLKLFLERLPEVIGKQRFATLLRSGGLLLYACKELSAEIIGEVLKVSARGDIVLRNRARDSCLHLLALNRKVPLVLAKTLD